MKTKTIIIIILVILLLLAGAYIGYNELQKDRIKYYNAGTNYGSYQTVATIISKAITCEPVSLNFENQTYQLKEVRCPVDA